MAALCAAIAIIAVVVPFAAGLSLLGTVPMGLLAYRYRLRVLITATVAALAMLMFYQAARHLPNDLAAMERETVGPDS